MNDGQSTGSARVIARGFTRAIAFALTIASGCGEETPGAGAGAAGQFIPVAGEGGVGSTAMPMAGVPAAAGGGGIVTAGMNGGAAGSVAGGEAGAAGMAAATGAPTWSAVYAEVIMGSGCNGGFACHGGSVGMLTMTDPASAYTALVGVPAMGTSLMPSLPNCKDSGLTRVIAGDPDNSLLVQKIEKEMPACGTRMPTSRSLPPAQVQQIRTWIMNGAMND
jgi:hypothetical protein